MIDEKKINNYLERLKTIAPSGYALALHVEYTTPRFMFQTYKSDWLCHYHKNGWLAKDPTVSWGFQNLGVVKWSDLDDKDESEVLKCAKEFGLRYGVTLSVETDGSRSVSGFSRSDREFTSDEADELTKIVGELHELTHKNSKLPEDDIEVLRRLSIKYTQSPTS